MRVYECVYASVRVYEFVCVWLHVCVLRNENVVQTGFLFAKMCEGHYRSQVNYKFTLKVLVKQLISRTVLFNNARTSLESMELRIGK